MTQPPSPDHLPPGPYGAPAQPHAFVEQGPGAAPPPHGAPPQAPYGAPPQYSPPPHGAPPQAPYGAPPQYSPPPYGAPPQAAPPQYQPPVYAPPAAPTALPPQPAHGGGYAEHPPAAPYVPPGLPPIDAKKKRPSGWNVYSLGLLAMALAVVGVVVWPQLRARHTEGQARPLVQALSQRDASARCPRYITAVITNVGSVRLDANGGIADRTDLTGPVCDGLRHFYGSGGKAELACLTAPTPACTDGARRSVVAISVVAHESMHLRGQLDEGRAECESMGESQTLSTALGIPLDQARMISWLHYASLNPYTPPQYNVSPDDCAPVAELEANPPGTPQTREALRLQVANTWRDLAG